MTLEIFDCAQNSDDWLLSRLGIPTASMFATVLAKGRGGGESKTRQKYLYELAGEILTGRPTEGYSNAAMERGHDMEDEARDAYAFLTDHEPIRIGFIRRGRAGASPDALIGDDGLLEIKTKQPSRLIEAMLRDKDDIPPEHRAQCQGQLWVSEREWLDLAAYWPGMPLVTFRAYRDEEYIKTLADAVSDFNDDLDEIVDRVRNYGGSA